MTLQEMLNNGGATLDSNLNAVTLTDGFMVSMEGGDVLDVNDLAGITLAMVKASNIAKQAKGRYVGLWVDNGKCYVDVSRKIDIFALAFSVAQANKQLAMWDNLRHVAIDTTSECLWLPHYDGVLYRLQKVDAKYKPLYEEFKTYTSPQINDLNALLHIHKVKTENDMKQFIDARIGGAY